MNSLQMEILARAAQAVQTAAHGEKQTILQQASKDMGVSMQTLYRHLDKVQHNPKPRKQRSDKGQTALTYEEAKMISGVLTATLKANGKRLGGVEQVIEDLRENKLIEAWRVDKSTGELVPMSTSAIARALRSHGVHPDQMLTADPHLMMVSLHPNHVWQIDASLCVLYYLKPSRQTGSNGLHVMAHEEFYKNKPKNLQRVMADRVWSYEVTDHCSGWIYVEYVMGAESGENFCNVLINAMQERSGADVMHGVPRILYMDKGSANTSAKAKNLCHTLGIEAMAHAPGNARATGQVENARNIIERQFEFGLRFRPVADLDELNALAKQWRIAFNAQKKHSRHNMARTTAWLKIREDQLVKAPSVEMCQKLAIETPVERKVTPAMRCLFAGGEFDVSRLPVQVGDTVLITRSAWAEDVAQVILVDEDGHSMHHQVPKVIKNEFGFPTNAENQQVFGEGYKTLPATTRQKARDEIDQLMTGTESKQEAEKAIKAKAIPLGGQFDPFKTNADIEANLPTIMPRKGQEHELTTTRRVEALPLTHVQAAMRLRQSMRDEWQPEHMQWLQANHPDGVPEDALSDIENQLRNPQQTSQKPALRVVGG